MSVAVMGQAPQWATAVPAQRVLHRPQELGRDIGVPFGGWSNPWERLRASGIGRGSLHHAFGAVRPFWERWDIAHGPSGSKSVTPPAPRSPSGPPTPPATPPPPPPAPAPNADPGRARP